MLKTRPNLKNQPLKASICTAEKPLPSINN